MFNASGFVHVACAGTYFETTDLLDRMEHFAEELSADDRGELESLLATPRAD